MIITTTTEPEIYVSHQTTEFLLKHQCCILTGPEKSGGCIY